MMLHPARLATERDDETLPIGVVRRPLEPRCRRPRQLHRNLPPELVGRHRAAAVGFAAKSAAGVLRGVHVHPRHDEFILVTAGTMLLGIKDLRPDSPSFGLSALVALSGERPELVTLPHGVAHGFYHATDASMLLAASHYYDPADDFGCHWADPETRHRLAVPQPGALRARPDGAAAGRAHGRPRPPALTPPAAALRAPPRRPPDGPPPPRSASPDRAAAWRRAAHRRA